jgi:RNA polymerase sigma-70 factor (ECF subfamily)
MIDETEAISRCLAGEREAFEFIVNKYQPGLLTLAWGILRNREEAMDVTQDVLVKAYLNLNSFNPEKSFRNWIYAIAYHRCLDHRRKEESSKNYVQRISRELLIKSRRNSQHQKLEELGHLKAILQKLNERERLAISLTVNDGYTASEVANVLGCAESTARVHLFNAKRKLKKLFEGNVHV